MPKIIQSLWFEKDMKAALTFYTTVIPNSAIHKTTTLAAESPSGPAESIPITQFTLGGQNYQAMQAPPLSPFNYSFSITVSCDTQAELDTIYNAFLKEGSEAQPCGWVHDKWGLYWQIVPKRLMELMADPDRTKARRVAEAMLKMTKLDLPTLEAAAAAK